MLVCKYAVYTRKDHRLVEIKVIAENSSEAYKIARSMAENSPYIDIDEGIFLNDEYED